MLKPIYSHKYSYWCWGAHTLRELKQIVRKNGYTFYIDQVSEHEVSIIGYENKENEGSS